MSHVLKGATMVLGDRSLWRFLLVPLLWAGILYLAVFFGGLAVVTPAVRGLAEKANIPGPLATAGTGAIYVTAWFFVSGVVFWSFAGMVSPLLWDKLSREIEKRLNIAAPSYKPTWAEFAGDMVLRMPVSLALVGISVACGWVLFGVVAFLVGAFLVVSDSSAPAFARRRVFYPSQPFKAFGCKGATGLAVAGGLTALVPFLTVLVMPIYVAAGTLMVAESHPSGSVE